MAFPQHVQIDTLPQSIEEFLDLQERVAGTPQGGAAMLVVALLGWTNDRNLGRQCLAAAIDSARLVEGPAGARLQQLNSRELRLIESQLQAQPYLPRSYVQRTTPADGYRLPPAPYGFAFSQNPHSGDPATGTYKAFVACSGADSARPVTLRRDERGIWKANEWSSLIVGVRWPDVEP